MPTQQDPTLDLSRDDVVKTQHWHKLENDKIQCDVCPRLCKLRNGQRGLCFVRACVDDQIVLTTWGRSSGFIIDPIEKKPLNHYYPGSSVLSFGTAGCNLACKFCQNWDISKSREMDTLASLATPEMLAKAAYDADCKSIAYTYNDPVIFHEYAIDIALACKEYGVKSVAVSAGYMCEESRREFYQYIDAANIDLKGFTDKFYWKVCGGHLQSVLETLEYLKHETNVWFEITTLLIPGQNDSEKELHEECEWIVEHLGRDVPIHFTAFHPDYKMLDIPQTPASILTTARDIALSKGIYYVYVGNVHDVAADSTYCHQCGELLIQRDWYELGLWKMAPGGTCAKCGTPCAGVFDDQPGSWGRKRVRMLF